MIVHQSMLAAWSRCPAEVGYKRAGVPSKTNSAAAYGSVIHHVLQAMERSLHEGRAKYKVKSPEFHQHYQMAVQLALEQFTHYWNPHNIETITEPVPADGWLPKAGYAELRSRGLDAIRKYADLIKFDDHELLALEYGFMVPIDGTWDYELNQPHMLGGSVDRLAARHFSRQLACCVDDYKGLALDTLLPTPNGWTTMNEVTVGDALFAENGSVTRVTGKSQVKNLRCFRITFDDSSQVVCDEEHLWNLAVGKDRHEVTWTALQMFERGVLAQVAKGRFQRDLRVDNPAPLDLPEVTLPIPPYVLGYWLGNGKAADGSFCADLDDVKHIVQAIEATGFRVGPEQHEGRDTRGRTHTIHGLRGLLSAAGLLRNKHIPPTYLRASAEQRLELIRGLMDSDGHANLGRSEQVFTTTDEHLLRCMQDLVSSMGWNWSSWIGQRTGFGMTVTAHDLHFRPVNAVPYHLPRKALRVPATHQLSRQRLIQAIEEVESVPTQCIAVDHPSQTYLCTDRMTVTHNTGKEQHRLRYNIQFTAYCYATTKLEFWVGHGGEDGFGQERGTELYERFDGKARRGTWINMRTFKYQDAGWREATDYARFALAVDQIASSIQADIFPLTISGDACTFCFTGDTEVWTDQGVRPLRVLAGTEPNLLVGKQGGGAWLPAPVRSFGESDVLTVSLALGRDTRQVRATPNHRWHVLTRSDPSRTESHVVETAVLRPGDRLLSIKPASRLGKIKPSPFGVAAGIVYGDGDTGRGTASRITLWDDSRELLRYFPLCESAEVVNRNGVQGISINSLPIHFNERPSLNEAASYLYGWLAGYFAADGHITERGQATLSSANPDDLEFARTVACRLGIFTHEVKGYDRIGIGADTPTRLYRFTLPLDQLDPEFFVQQRHLRYWRDGVPSNRVWVVTDVEDRGEREEVFCATVPEHHNFTLAGFINVGNCDYRRSCGGTGIADEEAGAPSTLVKR